jgi:hypothetical protein
MTLGSWVRSHCGDIQRSSDRKKNKQKPQIPFNRKKMKDEWSRRERGQEGIKE